MSTNAKALVITFSEDLSDDQVLKYKELFLMLNGVIDVERVPVNIQDYANRQRAKYELVSQIWGVLVEDQ